MIVREEAIGYASASSSTPSTMLSPKFISATSTVFDNLDRPILVAGWRHDNVPDVDTVQRWAGDHPDGGQSAGFTGDYAMPDVVAEVLGLGPISLSHTLYDERGRAYEQRTYNVEVAGGSTYEFTRTYRDDLDRVIGELSPTGFVVNQYDGLGRVVCTSWWTKQPTIDVLLPNECENMGGLQEGAVELTCTQTEYDAFGNVLFTVHFDRKDTQIIEGGARITGKLVRTNGKLGLSQSTPTSNAIVTYTYNWYDKAKRLAATAYFGTNSPAAPGEPGGSFFVNGAPPQYFTNGQPIAAPKWECSSANPPVCGYKLNDADTTAIVTRFGYDLAGRRIWTQDAKGVVTRTWHDLLGHELLVAENWNDDEDLAPEGDSAESLTPQWEGPIRYTAYHYPRGGLMDMTVAVKVGCTPGLNTPPAGERYHYAGRRLIERFGVEDYTGSGPWPCADGGGGGGGGQFKLIADTSTDQNRARKEAAGSLPIDNRKSTIDNSHDDHPELDPSFESGGFDDPKLLAQAAAPQIAKTLQEYIHGLEYIDEHVAMQDDEGMTQLVIQDANYNVVALVDFLGYGLTYQSHYAPYGHLQYHEDGQGQTAYALAYPEGTIIALKYPFAFQGKWHDQEIGGYHFDNRLYLLGIARFAQMDPNGQALALLHAGLMNGSAPMIHAAVDMLGQQIDGPNPYEPFRSNPITNRDPSGLFMDDDVDDAAAGYFADRAATQIEVLARARVLGRQAARMLAEMAEQMLLESAAAAVWAPAPYAFAAADVASALYYMYQHGFQWNAVGGLAANLYGTRMSAGARPGLGIHVPKGKFGLHLRQRQLEYHVRSPSSGAIRKYRGGKFSAVRGGATAGHHMPARNAWGAGGQRPCCGPRPGDTTRSQGSHENQ